MATVSRSKLFWGTAVTFGVATGIPRFQHGRPLVALVTSVLSGLLFGGFVIWNTDRYRRRLTSEGIDPGNMEPIQASSIAVKGDLSSVYEACRRSLMRLRKLRVTSENPTTGELRAKIGCTWRSFGETISVSITDDGPDATVHIESKPRLSTTQADWGKSVENIALFKRYLVSELAAPAPNTRLRGP